MGGTRGGRPSFCVQRGGVRYGAPPQGRQHRGDILPPTLRNRALRRTRIHHQAASSSGGDSDTSRDHTEADIGVEVAPAARVVHRGRCVG